MTDWRDTRIANLESANESLRGVIADLRREKREIETRAARLDEDNRAATAKIADYNRADDRRYDAWASSPDRADGTFDEGWDEVVADIARELECDADIDAVKDAIKTLKGGVE